MTRRTNRKCTSDIQCLPQIHYDNWTVPLVELAWLGLTVMIGIALFRGKVSHELFYYTHHFAIIFLVACVTHAWSFWSAHMAALCH